jgi:phosphate starvation-inducible protein PhoH and related proteins
MSMQDGPALRARRKAPAELRELAGVDVKVSFEDNRIASLVFGQFDENLAHIERRLRVRATANGNQVQIKGPTDAVEQARRVLGTLNTYVKQGRELSLGDVDGAIAEAIAQGSLFPSVRDAEKGAFDQISTRKRGPVKARTANQHAYLQLLKQYELVFAEGPAGTDKTWLAVGHAVSLLERGAVSRMILSRPAVEAGENLGFLPGDMREKVDPYLRPVYDALFDFMDPRHVERGLQTGMIEIAPLAFMRGRTLSNAVVLLDEAQNSTSVQMKMFLTRLGEGSRMVVTGDPTQIDLPGGQRSGMVEAIDLLKTVDGIGHVVFHQGDVVRHDLVRRIVHAYETAGKSPRGRPTRERG